MEHSINRAMEQFETQGRNQIIDRLVKGCPGEAGERPSGPLTPQASRGSKRRQPLTFEMSRGTR
jgi:hypothetical protein